MESNYSLTQLSRLLTITLVLVFFVPNTHAGPWKSGRATFYGGADGSGTKGGACGFEDPFANGYGFNTAALSSPLYKDGMTCGSCYELQCTDKVGCKRGAKPITVTATNLCPSGGWCSAPQEHFDLAEKAFLQFAEYKAGVVSIQYRRVPCRKPGGIRISITGHAFFNLVTITNVGGAGDITAVKVMGSENLPWTPLKRNWGAKWQADTKLIGRQLSFQVTTSDGKTITLQNIFPKNWQFELANTILLYDNEPLITNISNPVIRKEEKITPVTLMEHMCRSYGCKCATTNVGRAGQQSAGIITGHKWKANTHHSFPQSRV